MNRNRILIGLNLAVFLMMLGVGMIMALLPQRIIDLTGSAVTVGVLASSFALSYILLQVPIGNLSDRYGFKPFLAGGYLICFGAGMLFFFSDRPLLLFLGRVFQGAGEAPVWALAPAVLSLQYPAAKGKVIGFYNAAIHLGLTIGPLLGILLAKRLTGNGPFLFYAASCLAGAGVIFFSLGREDRAGSGRKQAITFKGLLSLTASRESLLALTGIALYGAGYGLFLTTIPAFLIRVKRFDPAAVGLFFTLFYVAVSIAQLITGPLSDRMGRKAFMFAGLLIAGAGLAFFPGLGQPWISAVLTAGGLGLGVFYLASMAFLNERAPESLKGSISGAYYLFWGIGFCFGPMVLGNLGGPGDGGFGYRLFAGLLALEAVLLLPARDGGMKCSRVYES